MFHCDPCPPPPHPWKNVQTKAEKNAIKQELKALKKLKPADIRKMKISFEEQLEEKEIEIVHEVKLDTSKRPKSSG